MIRRILTVSGLEEARKLLDPQAFRDDVVKLNRLIALKSTGYMRQTCSVDTGRAANGFLGLFTKYGLDYSRYPAGALAHPYPRVTPPSPRERQSLAAMQADSSVVEDGPNIIVTNRVQYVEYINSGTTRMGGTGFIDDAVQLTLAYAQKVMNWYGDLVTARSTGGLKATPDQGPGEMA